MSLSQSGQFSVGNPRTPLETLTDGWLDFVELSCVNTRCLPSLDGAKNLKRICPPAHIHSRAFEPERIQFTLDTAKSGDDRRIAVVQKLIVNDAKLLEVVFGGGLPGYKDIG